MKLGIKVGLKSHWKADLIATRPDFCEIWFDSRNIEKYDDLFAYLKKEAIPAGIHFWGATPDGTLANLAYPDDTILHTSRELVRKTIEAAAKQQVIYVNLHPCGKLLSRVDFDKETFTPYTEAVAIPSALTILEESLRELTRYAYNQAVSLTLESTALLALGSPWTGKFGRMKPTNIGEFTVSEIELLLRMPKLYFANDFGHSGSNIATSERDEVKRLIFNIARRLASQTKLLHVSYIIPPYNGTDYHGCLYYDEFSTPDAVPNRDEMKQLLKLFNDRDDVYALVEPETDHVRNFQTLKQLVAEIS